MTEFYNFHATSLDGTNLPLNIYQGKVVLIVNVASRCGFTSQYRGLEELYRKYSAQGFAILGFPCNQFGAQEPGNEEEIATFCKSTYDVSFPMFAKIDVNGPKAHPIYEFLKHSAPGILGSTAIKWNFTKFLIDREGNVKNRFAPTDTPKALENEIEALL
ncbi:MAG: glutathione peroxidase [Methylocystis sp.]